MLRIPSTLLAAGVLAALGAAPAVAGSRLPAETAIPVTLETTVSSASNHPEDRVDAKVRTDVVSNGKVVIPAGSELRGHVVTVRRSGKVKGRAYLSMSFNELRVKGKTYPISTRRLGAEAQATHGKDAKVIGGGTAAGAVVGAIVDGKGGAAKGALVGAGAGTGVVLTTRGKEVTFAAGSRWRVRLVKPLEID
jgi:hypothetical protein